MINLYLIKKQKNFSKNKMYLNGFVLFEMKNNNKDILNYIMIMKIILIVMTIIFSKIVLVWIV
jgi:hypothetical protein